MVAKILKDVIEHAETWPEEDQVALAEYAREIEAARTGVYVMNGDERAAVRDGLAQARRGDFVSEDDMAVFWKKHGVL